MTKGFKKLVASALLTAITLSACGVSGDITNDASINLAQINSNTANLPGWGKEVDKLPKLSGKQNVTLLSYLGFDNNKGAFDPDKGPFVPDENYRNELPKLLNFQELSGSDNKFNFLVQTDGAEDNDLKRYYIVNDKDSSKIVSPYIQLAEEKDSADSNVLQDFIKWGYSNYDAPVKILDIDSHGGSYKGIVFDQPTRNIMSISEVARAIKSSVGKVDILTFDACLMSSIEVGYELKDQADVMIGSEDSTLRTGMLYAGSLSKIIDNSKNPEDIARGILLASDRSGVKDYEGLLNPNRPNRQGKTPNVFTISAFRGKEMKNLVAEINNLSRRIMSKISTDKTAVSSAINGTKALRIDNDEDVAGQRDLYEILSRMTTIFTDPELKNAVVKTRNALNKAIVIARTNNLEKYARGIGINISPDSVQTEMYQATSFAKNSQWDEMIIAINK
jgi:hypothetical protein